MSRRTQVQTRISFVFAYRAITYYGWSFQDHSANNEFYPDRLPYNPITAEAIMVWAVPRPLAATKGISIDFFSFRYLDGSVP